MVGKLPSMLPHGVCRLLIEEKSLKKNSKNAKEGERERQRNKPLFLSITGYCSEALFSFRHPHFQGKIEIKPVHTKKVQILHAHSVESKKSEKQFKKRHKKRAEKEKECMTNSGLWGRSDGH